MSAKPECPVCKVAMDTGFVVDKGDYNVSAQQEWVAGAPELGFFGGLKLKGRDKHPVLTYRCPNCGMLRSYASPR